MRLSEFKPTSPYANFSRSTFQYANGMKSVRTTVVTQRRLANQHSFKLMRGERHRSNAYAPFKKACLEHYCGNTTMLVVAIQTDSINCAPPRAAVQYCYTWQHSNYFLRPQVQHPSQHQTSIRHIQSRASATADPHTAQHYLLPIPPPPRSRSIATTTTQSCAERATAAPVARTSVPYISMPAAHGVSSSSLIRHSDARLAG
jgi:hypothetical protein